MATKSTTKSPARKAATTARKPAKTVPQKAPPPKAKESKTKAADKPGPIAPTVPVKPPPPPPAPLAEVAGVSSTDGQAAEVVPPVEEEPKNVITIKPPIIVKELATQLGVKNFQLIKELMNDFNIF